MRTMKNWLLAALAVSLVGVGVAAEEKDEKKPTIKAIMRKFHDAPKGELKGCQKFAAGKLSDAETKEILVAYEDLTKLKAPKGDEESWKKKTTALFDAAKEVAAKKDGAVDVYKKAVDCAACHKDHKPAAPKPER